MSADNRTDEQIVRAALPALHQLGPRCFCRSCEAHAALDRITSDDDMPENWHRGEVNQESYEQVMRALDKLDGVGDTAA